MKKSLLYILAVLVGSLLFGACDKHDSASDPAPNSYSEFFINPPSFNTPSGSKVYWDDDGLWWDTSGDLVLINGTQFQIIKDKDNGNQWKTQSTQSVEERRDVGPIEGVFYCCYIGQNPLNSRLVYDSNSRRYLYSGVDFDTIVPLVGASDDNNMTLKPCCAVLKIINLDRNITSIKIPVAPADKFPYSGDIDPDDALVVNPGTKKNLFSNIAPINRTAYVILPMFCNRITTTDPLEFKYKEGSTTITKKTRSAVIINKGYVYVIDFDAVRQSNN